MPSHGPVWVGLAYSVLWISVYDNATHWLSQCCYLWWKHLSTFESIDFQEELVAGHATYMRQNPELRNLVSDFVQFLLLRKPTDVLAFSADYFETFGPKRSVAGSYLNSKTPERHPAVKSNQNIDYLSKVSYAD